MENLTGPGATPPPSSGPYPTWLPAPTHPGRTRQNGARKTLNKQRKRELFTAIRDDARLGVSSRALATKHHVHRRTIRKALQSETPPPRKKIHRQPPVLHGLREYIDAMLEADPRITATAIWQRLHDEQDATPSYPPSAPRSPLAEPSDPKHRGSPTTHRYRPPSRRGNQVPRRPAHPR